MSENAFRRMLADMTRWSFNFVGTPDYGALAEVLAAHFDMLPEQVCVYDNTWDVETAYEKRPAGRLWPAYDKSLMAAFVGLEKESAGPVCAWLRVEMNDVAAQQFEDRPLAHRMARALAMKMNILFYDPVPDPRDSPHLNAAHIEVTPQGAERKVWLWEFGDGAGGTGTKSKLATRRAVLAPHHARVRRRTRALARRR